jgi:hypothetical protein
MSKHIHETLDLITYYVLDLYEYIRNVRDLSEYERHVIDIDNKISYPQKRYIHKKLCKHINWLPRGIQ